MVRATVKPPTPESKIPIGASRSSWRGVRLLMGVDNVFCTGLSLVVSVVLTGCSLAAAQNQVAQSCRCLRFTTPELARAHTCTAAGYFVLRTMNPAMMPPMNPHRCACQDTPGIVGKIPQINPEYTLAMTRPITSWVKLRLKIPRTSK